MFVHSILVIRLYEMNITYFPFLSPPSPFPAPFLLAHNVNKGRRRGLEVKSVGGCAFPPSSVQLGAETKARLSIVLASTC